MITQGDEHLAADEYEKAFESFKKALDKRPNDTMILDRQAKLLSTKVNMIKLKTI